MSLRIGKGFSMNKIPPKDDAKPLGHRGGKPSLRLFKPGTAKRLFSYMAEYKFQLIFVVVCILVSAATGAVSSLFLGAVIDNHIVPMLGQSQPEFAGLIKAILLMGLIYAVGVLASLLYNRTMVVIGQGTLKKIRDKMFTHM